MFPKPSYFETNLLHAYYNMPKTTHVCWDLRVRQKYVLIRVYDYFVRKFSLNYECICRLLILTRIKLVKY